MPVRPPSGRFLTDTVRIYARVEAQGARAGPVESDVDPAEVAAAVQPTSMSDRPLRADEMAAERFGLMGANIVLGSAPPREVRSGTLIEHVANRAGALPAVAAYRAIGEPIPPSGGRGRWTIAANRYD